MPDTPEIPEVKDPFERLIALTIAILAVVLSFVSNLGDNAKTDAILKNTEAANRWAYYQSKSLKANLAETTAALLGVLSPADAAVAKSKLEAAAKEVSRYDDEKKTIMTEAQELEKQVAHSMAINDKSDLASLLLQIAVVVCSVAILVRWKFIYFTGVAFGIAGTVVGALGFMM